MERKTNMHSLSIPFGYLLVTLFLLAVILPEDARTKVLPTPTAPSEDDPRAAIELYFAAHALGKAGFITQAFSPEAKIQFVEDGERREWTRDEFAKRFQQPAFDEYRRVRRVQTLNVSGTAASAVLTLDYPQVLFTDHVSLLKIGGQWNIVSKVFSADQREGGQKALDKVLADW